MHERARVHRALGCYLQKVSDLHEHSSKLKDVLQLINKLQMTCRWILQRDSDSKRKSKPAENVLKTEAFVTAFPTSRL